MYRAGLSSSHTARGGGLVIWVLSSSHTARRGGGACNLGLEQFTYS